MVKRGRIDLIVGRGGEGLKAVGKVPELKYNVYLTTGLLFNRALAEALEEAIAEYDASGRLPIPVQD